MHVYRFFYYFETRFVLSHQLACLNLDIVLFKNIILSIVRYLILFQNDVFLIRKDAGATELYIIQFMILKMFVAVDGCITVIRTVTYVSDLLYLVLWFIKYLKLKLLHNMQNSRNVFWCIFPIGIPSGILIFFYHTWPFTFYLLERFWSFFLVTYQLVTLVSMMNLFIVLFVSQCPDNIAYYTFKASLVFEFQTSI